MNFEYLIAETHNWLAKSSVRQFQYDEHHKAINDVPQPMSISSGSKTRWRSIQPDVKNITAQWLELRAHLKVAILSKKCYAAELLLAMYAEKKTSHSYFFETNPSRCAEC